MKPRELHEMIMEAVAECPQVHPWPYKTFVQGSYYKKIKYNTLYDVAKYWEHSDLLWGKGYAEYLPNEAKILFREIRDAKNAALTRVCREFEK